LAARSIAFLTGLSAFFISPFDSTIAHDAERVIVKLLDLADDLDSFPPD